MSDTAEHAAEKKKNFLDEKVDIDSIIQAWIES